MINIQLKNINFLSVINNFFTKNLIKNIHEVFEN